MLKLAKLNMDTSTTLVIFLWLAMFAIGMTVPSPPFRNRLVEYGSSFGTVKMEKEKVVGVPPNSTLTFLGALACLGVVFIAFTPTNLAALCILGAMLGARAKAKSRRVAANGNDDEASSELVASPSLHGLCVFLALLAGQIVVQGELKWDETAPNMYFRLAATATLFSVMAGTNPRFLSDLARYFPLPSKDRAQAVEHDEFRMEKNMLPKKAA